MEHTTDRRRPPSGTAPTGTSPPPHLVVLPWGEPDGYVERLLRTQRSPSRSAWRQTSEACRSRYLAARRPPRPGPGDGPDRRRPERASAGRDSNLAPASVVCNGSFA
jgi:hypothetical protein